MKIQAKAILSILIIFSLNVHAQGIKELNNVISTMSKEANPKRVVSSMHKAIKNYNLDSLKHSEEIDLMKGSAALAFLKKNSIKKFESYVRQIKNKFNRTSYMNMGVDFLLNDFKNLAYAEDLAKKTIQLYHSYKDDSTARPENFEKESWSRFMKMAAYPYYETYAKILHTAGKNDTALVYQEMALANEDPENLMQTSAELYALLLASQHQEKKAYTIVKRAAELGRASDKMIVQLRELHTKLTGENADILIDSIRLNIKNAYLSELSKKIITNQKAANFELKDLNGNLISLERLQGKVVVLDFWATWCIPCIQSMPTMDKLRQQNPDVVFLFIATQESGSGALERVKSFVKKQQYIFDVLMDTQNMHNPKIFNTLVDYQITGIPAKVVINKKGFITFSSSGFTNETDLSYELQAMIEIAKTQ